MKNSKLIRREARHRRIRARLAGTANRPRLVVFRSLKKNYAQLVDDASGKVIAAASDGAVSSKTGNKSQRAKTVGAELAKKALEKGINACVFDRNGYKYHGRVKALADGAREGGLKF
ncbi:50S ribosomal protein L18 [Candidatus Peregrinibacteria bacterium]|nr:50S ribosomal protein L18 [Candidatus Peregrinibacteria bacterium]